MKYIEQKVISFISRYGLITTGDKVLVAFSGGPDSVFALHFLHKFKRKFGIEIFAVHFNHQLRGKESEKDELFCEKFCETLKVPLYSVKLDVKTFAKQNKISIEEAARKLRYNSLEEIAQDFECSKILTAHNQSDNTETVLLNFFSGTGYSGLTGIPIRRSNIIRPFLCLTKKQITDYLKQNKIKYRVDKSNKSNDFKRNLLRNKVIPVIREKINPSVDDAVFRSSKVLENFLKQIDNSVEKIITDYSRISNGTIFIKSSVNKKYDEHILGEFFKKLLQENYSYEFKYKDIIELRALFEKQKGKTITLSSKLYAVRESNGIKIQKNLEDSAQSSFVLLPGETKKYGGKTYGINTYKGTIPKLGTSKSAEFISGDSLEDKFILRKWKNGDRFIPLGMKGFKKISDFLTDCKIPSSEKKSVLVLENRNNIVWVVGLRIDERYKVIPKTKTVYKLWKK